MIDEKSLHARLTAAAAQQDELLPRALEDDLSAGRRGLRRRQLLTGAGVTGAVATVAVLALGMTTWLSPNANPAPEGAPIAGQSSATPSAPVPGTPTASIGPGPDTTGDIPVPVESGPPVPAADRTFNQNLAAALYAHLDPTRRHLDFSSGGFRVNRQLGTILSGGNRIGWRMPGQMGAEGIVSLSVHPASRKPRACGSNPDVRVRCREIQLPNGRTAELGRSGDFADVHYQQPDGEWITVSVSTLFGNNTEIPVHDMGITDQELLALVQDSRLNLPKLSEEEQTNENALKNFSPSAQQFRTAAARALTGGTLSGGRREKVTEQASYQLTWRKGAVTATVEVGVDSKVGVSSCREQLSILAACDALTLPNGRKVQLGQRAMTYRGDPQYVIGGTYLQPDGDSAHVRIRYPGTKLPTGAITQQQLINLLTDPSLDK
ncbi:hypothetical protein Kfla_4013 [Kribbella flavida DSM 17836]|uniref:Uncharacterized protein n=1 Tax=Kribbella flavida (strain DSM 17836 / JCM 10339 / NBRC 14399) TaxID=479435 RepID=D2PRB4_KRIFD|nr:hypothetical protein [Kribbella flavida]ADB33062.1 hypothetical protein Kfla_4013 [Kribbella flavida DSM 17836]